MVIPRSTLLFKTSVTAEKEAWLYIFILGDKLWIASAVSLFISLISPPAVGERSVAAVRISLGEIFIATSLLIGERSGTIPLVIGERSVTILLVIGEISLTIPLVIGERSVVRPRLLVGVRTRASETWERLSPQGPLIGEILITVFIVLIGEDAIASETWEILPPMWIGEKSPPTEISERSPPSER